MGDMVSIVKVEGSIQKSVEKAVNLAGGFQDILGKGERIILKPNLVAPRRSYTGATTDLKLVRTVSHLVREAGGRPALYETPAIEWDWETVYGILGVFDLAEELDIEILTGKSEWSEVTFPDKGGRIRIPKVFLESKFINLPKLKTHVSAGMTCSLKNLIGILPEDEKRKVHVYGIDRSIYWLSRILNPSFTIVDANIVMEGNGPTYGSPFQLGLIVAGRDMISVDEVCCSIVGMPPGMPKYLDLVRKEFPSDGYEIAGEDLDEVSRNLSIPQQSLLFHFLFRAMFTIDHVAFSRVYGMPLNKFLYNSGRVGNNPDIIEEKCDHCGICIKHCPAGNAIDLETLSIRHRECLRCLTCYEVCPMDAIAVRGISHRHRG